MVFFIFCLLEIDTRPAKRDIITPRDNLFQNTTLLLDTQFFHSHFIILILSFAHINVKLHTKIFDLTFIT